MKKRTATPKTLPVLPLTAKQLEKQKAKATRAEQTKKSKEVSQALVFSKHERLARALMFLQILKK